jgi:hypothetical protein
MAIQVDEEQVWHLRDGSQMQGNRERTGKARLQCTDLLSSPELYPTSIDFDRRMVVCVRMTPETYRDSVFLDNRTKYRGTEVRFRLDDVIFVARQAPPKRVHYILNTAYCCSTLLARCFELIPTCFVLKEPRALVQVANMMETGDARWQTGLELVHKLLTRTYHPDQFAVIKPYEPCNRLGMSLLKANSAATVTFLITPLRSFILSILKQEERRDWVRTRSAAAIKDAAGFLPFSVLDAVELSSAQAAACVWMANRYMYRELSSAFGERVLLINGDELARSPRQAFGPIPSLCGIDLSDTSLDELFENPLLRQYSKDVQRPFDGDSREQQLSALERCWGAEADAGVVWAYQHGLSQLQVREDTLF